MFIDWSGALTEKGRERMMLLSALNEMKHEELALQEGKTERLASDQEEKLAAFTRTAGSGERIISLVNTTNEPIRACVKVPGFRPGLAEELLEYGTAWEGTQDGLTISLLPYGYVVLK